MNLKDLTLGELATLKNLFDKAQSCDNSPYIIGGNYLIRTVTMTLAGKIVKVFSNEIELTDASWVADTGRFAEAINTSKFEDVEKPQKDKVIVGRNAIVDAWQIDSLPTETK